MRREPRDILKSSFPHSWNEVPDGQGHGRTASVASLSPLQGDRGHTGNDRQEPHDDQVVALLAVWKGLAGETSPGGLSYRVIQGLNCSSR